MVVSAPGVDRAIRCESEGVGLAPRHRHDVHESRDDGGHGAVGRGPVADLTVAVLTPGLDARIRQHSEGMGLSAVERHRARERAHLGRRVPIRGRPIAELAAAVLPPGVDDAGTDLRHGVTLPGRDAHRRREPGHDARSRPAARRPVAQLPDVVVAPARYAAVAHGHEHVRPARGDVGDAGQDEHRREAVRGVADAHLSVAVLAPEPERPVALQGARKARPGGDGHDAGEPGNRCRARSGRRRPASQLTRCVGAPAPHDALAVQGQTVIGAGGNRHDARQAPDRTRDPALRRRPVTEPPVRVVAPREHRAVGQQGQRESHARLHRPGRQLTRDRVGGGGDVARIAPRPERANLQRVVSEHEGRARNDGGVGLGRIVAVEGVVQRGSRRGGGQRHCRPRGIRARRQAQQRRRDLQRVGARHDGARGVVRLPRLRLERRGLASGPREPCRALRSGRAWTRRLCSGPWTPPRR